MSLVLVIDDEPRIRTMLRRLLEEEGHDVIEAPTGEVGIELFNERRPDLTITDIILPGVDGCHVISEITQVQHEAKCIAISGGSRIGPFTHLMMARTCGAISVLSKPFQPSEMVATVREVLDGGFNAPVCDREGAEVNRNALVVDPDTSHSWLLCEDLALAGHKVTDTRDVEYCVNLIEQERFDVALVDVLLSRLNGVDLIQRLHALEDRPLTIAMADFESVSVRNAVMKRGADHFVGKPVDMRYVRNLLSRPSGFSAQVNGVDVLELLQFLLLSGKELVLEIRPAVGNMCRIYLHEGKVLHAVCGELQGEEAFYKGVSYQGGELVNRPWNNPDRLSIDQPGDFMLLEAARRRDEYAT
ncbi:response regulator [Thermodesulfobacteriota bacterium]